MNANELRIGNLVNYYMGAPMSENILTKVEWKDLKNIGSGDKNYEPIPLTLEWLKRFGFQSDNFTDEDRTPFMRIDDACGSFILDDEFILMDIDTRVQIKHVHQLQNLYFALTGEELTLKEND